MSQKRKYDEYHDPDYEHFPLHTGENQMKKSKISIDGKTVELNGEERFNKICEIVQREFNNELEIKENEINDIDKRLVDAKKLLSKIRYASVYSYYNRKNQIYSMNEIRNGNGNSEHLLNTNDDGQYSECGYSQQMTIHPSLKKLIGKRPINYDEILKVRPMRQAAKNATNKFHELKKPSKKECSIDNVIMESEIVSTSFSGECDTLNNQLPQEVQSNIKKPRIEQINSARRRNQCQHLIVVGNTSKYVGEEEAELKTNVTHKWLVYVATKTSLPIEKIISKVRFFLHESYQPNDIIEVASPPFQLAKRGWGEFTLRLQLYFHAYLQQKPIQIFHNLVLDKRHTGLQTMGAETLVEVWLNTGENIDNNENNDENVIESNIDQNQIQMKLEPIDSNPFYTDQKIPTSNITESTEPSSSASVKIESLATTSMTSNKKFLKFIDKSGKMSLIEMIPDPSNPKVFIIALPKLPNAKIIDSTPSKSIAKNIIFNPNIVSLSQTRKSNQSILKPQISLLKSNQPTNSRNIIVTNIDGLKDTTVRVFLPRENSSTKQIVTEKNQFEKIFMQMKFVNVTAAVTWISKYLPLIKEYNRQSDFHRTYPFIVKNMETFDKMNKPKQRCYEWLRAQYIRNQILKHPHINNFSWTTKQIVIYGRMYGYSPIPIYTQVKVNKDVTPNEYRDIIKSTIDREHMYNDVISFSGFVNQWIDKNEENLKQLYIKNHKMYDNENDDELIIVDSIENTYKKNDNFVSQQETFTFNDVMIPMDENSVNECCWITEVCREMNVDIKPEKICDGIFYPAAQKVLQIAVRSFLENLLRETCALKFQDNFKNDLNTTINNDDILQTLSRIKAFDFLTNKHLGIEK